MTGKVGPGTQRHSDGESGLAVLERKILIR